MHEFKFLHLFTVLGTAVCPMLDVLLVVGVLHHTVPCFWSPLLLLERLLGTQADLPRTYQTCDSGSEACEAQPSPSVKILWPLSAMVLCALWQLLFTGTNASGARSLAGGPRVRC